MFWSLDRCRATVSSVASIAIVICCLLTGAPSSGRASPVSFTDDFSLSGFVGFSPRAIAVADLNGDNVPDLVSANFDSNAVSVRLANGDGTFGPSQHYAAGTACTALAIADMDNDGHLDVLVNNRTPGTETLTIAYGNGDGTFRESGVGYYPGADAYALAVGDFDEDNRMDVAVVNQSTNQVSILLGLVSRSTHATAPTPTAVVVADFNRDGHLDLAVSTRSGVVSVLLGDGHGGFGAASSWSTGLGSNALVAGDLNGDSYPDLAVSNFSSNTVSVLINDGSGGFLDPVDYATDTGPGRVAIADFQPDGIPDLVIANEVHTVSVFPGKGDGTFDTRHDSEAGADPVDLAVGDLDQNGRKDLAVLLSCSDQVSVLLNLKHDFEFGTPHDAPVGLNPWSVAIADVNRDGQNDGVVANRGGNTVSVLTASPIPDNPPIRVDYPAGTSPLSVAVSDLNGDNWPDIVVANKISASLGSVSVLLNRGDGTYGARAVYAGGPFESVVVSDIDGDTHPDIIAEGSGIVSVWRNNGNGTFGARTDYSAYGGHIPISVAVGDLNHDAHPDLIVSLDDGVATQLNNGDGTFGAASEFFAPPGGLTSESALAVGELTGDGNLDVVRQTSDLVVILAGGGDGSLGAPFSPTSLYILGSSHSFSGVAVADLNGDGHLDLAASTCDGVRIVLGTGDGTFGQEFEFGTGAQPVGIAIGLGNPDQHPDIITANAFSNTISALFNLDTVTGVSGGTASPPVPRLSVAPNPSSNLAKIVFDLPHEAHTKVEVFDLKGRLVRRLYDGHAPAGTLALSWPGVTSTGTHISSGIYFVRASSSGMTLTRKIVWDR